MLSRAQTFCLPVILVALFMFAPAGAFADESDDVQRVEDGASAFEPRWNFSLAGGISAYENYFGEERSLWDLDVRGVGLMLRLAQQRTEHTHIAGRYIGSKTVCISHETGTCPGSGELAALYGLSASYKWGQFGIEGGPALGYINPDATPTEKPTVPTVGLAAGASAYFTPFDFFGIGVEIPATVNQEGAGFSALLSLKVGEVRP